MAVHQINVSQLKLACLDPAWRKKWIDGENPSTNVFAPAGAAPVYGKLFHAKVNRFLEWLTSDPIALRLKTADQVWDAFYERFAEEPLTRLSMEGKLEDAHLLGENFKSFSERVAQLRKQCRQFGSWNDVFITHAEKFQDVPFDLGSAKLFVSGEIDGLRHHPRYTLQIVDYKLTKGSHQDQDMIQLAIYAALLRYAKPDLSFAGIVEYYLPELQVVEISTSALNDLFDAMVLPVMRELTGARAKDSASAPSSAEDPNIDGIQRAFKSFKLDVQVFNRKEAPQLIRYFAKPAEGVKVSSLGNRAEDLQVRLKLAEPPLITPGPGYVAIDIAKARPDAVLWENVVRLPAFESQTSHVSFPIGINADGDLIVGDLADSNMAHALVGGASGSGKSEFLKSAVATLVYRNSPEQLRISLVDPKILTFTSLQKIPHLSGPIIKDMGEALECLREAVKEMDRRYEVLAHERLEKLSQRFEAGRGDIPYWVLVFDEFADLILNGREMKKDFETLVARIAGKGRAAGVHLILATQRPDKEIVTGLIKANLPLKVCLKVTAAINSQIILGQNGGESLLGRGDLLCDLGKGIQRAQSPYITRAQIEGLNQIRARLPRSP